MTKTKEIQLRHSVIRGWLESGMRISTVSTMIQARFQMSRSTAYTDIQAVSQEIQMSDDGPAEEQAPMCPDTLLASLQYQFDIAAAVGDVDSMTKLVKSMDSVQKWRGYHTTTTGALQHPTV
jgi:hypothetical protein